MVIGVLAGRFSLLHCCSAKEIQSRRIQPAENIKTVRSRVLQLTGPRAQHVEKRDLDT